MSARLREVALRRLPMTLGRLDEVLAIEQAAYEFPWTRGNFIDSLAARYLAETLMSDTGVAGYFVAMGGIDEMHLLNLTVAPARQWSTSASSSARPWPRPCHAGATVRFSRCISSIPPIATK